MVMLVYRPALTRTQKVFLVLNLWEFSLDGFASPFIISTSFIYERSYNLPCSLTSGGWTDEIGDTMEEIHHTQCQRQVPSSHQVGCHHGDQGHIGAVKVTVENSEGHEEQERPQQWHKEAAEAFHHHREDVTYQTVGLQTPKGAQRALSKRKPLTLVHFTFKDQPRRSNEERLVLPVR